MRRSAVWRLRAISRCQVPWMVTSATRHGSCRARPMWVAVTRERSWSSVTDRGTVTHWSGSVRSRGRQIDRQTPVRHGVTRIAERTCG
jgi:hypothetical protein